MFNYERDYGQKNGETNTEPDMQNSQVIPRTNSELFRRRKELGIYHRSAAVRDHCRDFGVANCGSSRRDERITPNYGKLKRFVSEENKGYGGKDEY